MPSDKSSARSGEGVNVERIKIIIQKNQKIHPDVILTVKGETLDKNTLYKLKKNKNKIVNWFPEPMFQYDLAKKIAPYYDYFFHFDPAIVNKLRNEKHSNVHYLPFAAAITPGYKKKIYDVSFIGTYSTNREKVLSKLTMFNLNIWGDSRWLKSSLKKNVKGGRISQNKMKNIIKKTKINLNIHNETNLAGANLRNFEITGCGGFLLTDYVKDFKNLFNNGKEIVWYKNDNELINIINFYLKNNKLREKIAENCYLKIVKTHNYALRIKHILELTKTSIPNNTS